MVSGNIAKLHGSISAETEQTAQPDRALAELEHGERVRSRVEQVVIKAVPDQGRWRGLGLRRCVGGNEEKDRGYKPDLYCSSQVCHSFTFCSRSAKEAPGLKFFVCPV